MRDWQTTALASAIVGGLVIIQLAVYAALIAGAVLIVKALW